MEVLQTIGMCVGALALMVIAFEMVLLTGALASLAEDDLDDEIDMQAALEAHFGPVKPIKGRKK